MHQGKKENVSEANGFQNKREIWTRTLYEMFLDLKGPA